MLASCLEAGEGSRGGRDHKQGETWASGLVKLVTDPVLRIRGSALKHRSKGLSTAQVPAPRPAGTREGKV